MEKMDVTRFSRYGGSPPHPDRDGDMDKWCAYHKEHGHNTKFYRHLKDEMETLIKKGHLGNFIAQGCKPPQQPWNIDNRD